MGVLDTRLGLWTDDNQSTLGHLHDIQALGFDWLAVRTVYHPSQGGQLHTQPYQPDVVQQLVTDAATISFSIIAQSLLAGCTT